VITSGHLGAVFSAPPRQVGISLSSAQATLMLPATVTYAVSDQVMSGYIRVGIPESASSQRTVTAPGDLRRTRAADGLTATRVYLLGRAAAWRGGLAWRARYGNSA
jgi:hypothetical protein